MNWISISQHQRVRGTSQWPMFLGSFLAVICIALVPPEAMAGELSVKTKFTCSGPNIPAIILSKVFPQDVAVIVSALGSKDCQYTSEAMRVTPISFIRKMKTSFGAAEPYGYIWAVLRADNEIGYWFLWKDEHQAIRKRISGA